MTTTATPGVNRAPRNSVQDILGTRIEGESGGVAPALETAALAAVIDLVRRHESTTRPALVAESGLSRKVVTQRVEQAIELGLIAEGPLAPSAGGRQARTLHFHRSAGHIFAALVGASEMTVAVSDLAGNLVDSVHDDWSVDNGPDATMNRIKEHLDTLSKRTRVDRPWAIGVGLPGPVDFSTGRLVAPPIMPGWDGFSARAWLRDHFDAPVWVDNDVNLMALGEFARGCDGAQQDMLYVKIGTGVGAGLIFGGRLIRGQRGGAGDIGHLHVTDDPAAICRCGRTGCLEAVGSGWSLLLQATARAQESPVFSAALAERGRLVMGDLAVANTADDSLAIELIENGARQIGDVVANLVNVLNPGLVVVGGGALHTGDRLVNILSETIRLRSTDLSARDLQVRASSLGYLEGVTGAALLAAENLLAPAALTRWVEDGSPLGHAAALQRYASAFS